MPHNDKTPDAPQPPTIDQAKARQTVLDVVSHGPQSMPQLGCAMLAAGVPDGLKYFAARLAVTALVGERKLEPFELACGTIVYRLPAKTPFETRKDK